MRRFPILCAAALALVGCRRTHEPPTVERLAPVAELAPPSPEAVAGTPQWVPPLPSAKRTAAAPAPLDEINFDGGAPPPVLDGGTVNGNPKGPRAAALNEVVEAAHPAIQSCLDAADLPAGAAVPVRIAYRIMPNGRTVDVDVSAPAPRPTVDCLRQVADSLHFPSFEGEPVTGSLPYAYRRR